jgi:hypothetical protein
VKNPDEMNREELLGELATHLSEPFLTIGREQCTTEQLRRHVKGARAQLAHYAAMGIEDMRGKAVGSGPSAAA